MPNHAPIPDTVPRLQLRRISKRYPGCLANDAIDLTIALARSMPCSGKTAREKAR